MKDEVTGVILDAPIDYGAKLDAAKAAGIDISAPSPTKKQLSAMLDAVLEDNARLYAWLGSIKAELDEPGGTHQYKKGIHASPCAACGLRGRVATALDVVQKAKP